MPRRATFQWTSTNILILVVVTALIALGAAYWAQISQNIGSGLGAFVGGAGAGDVKTKPVPVDGGRCLADTTAEPLKMGKLTFKGALSAKDETTVKKLFLTEAGKYIKSINCNVTHEGSKTIELPGFGEVTSGEDGLKVPDAVKEQLKCSRNKEAKTQCATMCIKTGTQCTIAHAATDCTFTSVKEVPQDDPALARKKLKKFEITAECDVKTNVTAQCKCASATECYASRGSIEIGPDHSRDLGEDGVACICPNEDKAKKDCPALLAALCKTGEKYTETTRGPLKELKKYIVEGRCAKETSTPTPETSPISTPTPSETSTPTPTPTVTTTATPTTTSTATPSPSTTGGPQL